MNKLMNTGAIMVLAFLLVLVGAQVVQANDGENVPVAAENLVGWWKLDDTSGMKAADASGNNIQGTLKGDLSFEKNGFGDEAGRAMEFDGLEYIDISSEKLRHFGDFDPKTGFTMAGWVATSQDGYLISLSNSKSKVQLFGILIYKGKVRFQYRTDNHAELGDFDSNSAVSDEQWHHVACVREGVTFNIYIDGKLDATVRSQKNHGTMTTDVASIGVQRRSGNMEYPLAGCGDDIRLYNRALTAEEIQSIYKKEAGEIKKPEVKKTETISYPPDGIMDVRAYDRLLTKDELQDVYGKGPIKARDSYLLLDKRLISSVENVALRQGVVKKHEGNPVLKDDLPWEVNGSHMYPSVVFDPKDKLYKCWRYVWFTDGRKKNGVDGRTVRKHLQPRPDYPKGYHEKIELGWVYAYSKDGIHWTKPKLKNVLYKGEPTNIVFFMTERGSFHLDLYDKNPQRRFKLFFKDHDDFFTAFSPDGIDWSEPHYSKISTAGDTGNQAFWNPLEREYVAIIRNISHGAFGYGLDNKSIPWLSRDPNVQGFVEGQRVVARSTSKDFINWTPPERVFQYGHTLRQIYGFPTLYTHGVFIAVPTIYDTKQSYIKKLTYKNPTAELKNAGTSMRMWPGLTWSPDTRHWAWIDERGKAMIPLSEDRESDEFGMIIAARSPIVLDNEIRFYYSAQKKPHGNLHSGWLGLATLRADGWAGYVPKDDAKDALVETHPVICSGTTLLLAADADNGSVVVTLKDSAGNTLAESKPVTGSKSYTPVTWKKGFKLSEYKGQLVRLKFTINHAKLYSFKFIEYHEEGL